MTETLLQKLEEKMMLLLTEVEDLRGEVVRLRQETSSLRAEREGNTAKLSDLLSLLDSIAPEQAAAPVAQLQPVATQGGSLIERSDQEYA